MDNAERLAQYRNAINSVVVLGTSATAAIIKSELARALPALLDRAVPLSEKPAGNTLVVGTLDELKADRSDDTIGRVTRIGRGRISDRLSPFIASAEGATISSNWIASSQTTLLDTCTARSAGVHQQLHSRYRQLCARRFDRHISFPAASPNASGHPRARPCELSQDSPPHTRSLGQS